MLFCLIIKNETTVRMTPLYGGFTSRVQCRTEYYKRLMYTYYAYTMSTDQEILRNATGVLFN